MWDNLYSAKYNYSTEYHINYNDLFKILSTGLHVLVINVHPLAIFKVKGKIISVAHIQYRPVHKQSSCLLFVYMCQHINGAICVIYLLSV